ncbi:DNA repair protein recA homolog 2, mitochondrial-like protein [Drosera capensis]
MAGFKRQLLRSAHFNLLSRRFLSSLGLQNKKTSAIMHDGLQTSCLPSAVDVSEFDYDEPVDNIKAVEKDTALHLALKQMAGDFGKESMLSLSRFFSSRRAPVISTGSLKLDLALGIGGLPKGRMVEIYGKEASGKTTLALHVIKEAQKLGGYCAYLDAENALDPALAESIGVNTEKLLITQPDSAENMLNVVDMLTKSASIDVIVVDSVAALIPRCEIEGPIGRVTGYMQSEVMTKALRKIHYSLCRSKVLILFLNQVRTKVISSEGFGRAEEATCGGNALKFYAAVRLRISRTGLLKVQDKVNGLGICIQVVKNKLAPAMKKAELGIHFGRGIRCENEVLELALEHGLILKEGNSFFVEGEVFNNEQDVERYLVDNEVILDKIVNDLRSLLFHRK